MTVKTVEQIRAAYRVLHHIETHPEHHDQSSWLYLPVTYSNLWQDPADVAVTANIITNTCGTTACYAGWTVLLDPRAVTGEWRVDMSTAVIVDGQTRQMPTLAAQILGLTSEEQTALFHNCGTIGDLRVTVAHIFGPRPDDMNG